jgi:hypothetical protein
LAEQHLDLAPDTDQQVAKVLQVVHLALLPQVAVVAVDIILILAQAPELAEVVAVGPVMDMLPDTVQEH